MANLATDAIIQAIRDVLESEHGATRAIPAGTYSESILEAMGVSAESMHAMDKPGAEVRIVSFKKSKFSPSGPGNFIIYDLVIEVRLVRHINLEHQTTASLADNAKALAAADGDIIAQALTYHDNIAQTAAAVATQLVSGMLEHTSSTVGKIQVGEGGLIATAHVFSGMACVPLDAAAVQSFDVLLSEDGFDLLLETTDSILLE